MGARVEGLRARLVWQYASRGAFAPPAVERRVLCAAGRRGGGVGAHARRINDAFFGPGTTVEPFCRLEKLGDRPIFTCLQT